MEDLARIILGAESFSFSFSVSAYGDRKFLKGRRYLWWKFYSTPRTGGQGFGYSFKGFRRRKDVVDYQSMDSRLTISRNLSRRRASFRRRQRRFAEEKIPYSASLKTRPSRESERDHLSLSRDTQRRFGLCEGVFCGVLRSPLAPRRAVVKTARTF